MRKSILSSGSRWIGGAALVALILLTFGAAKGTYGQFPGVPQGHGSKAAGFPQPEEELYGIAAGGKMYVLGGYGGGAKPGPVGMNWQYDPATDKWTKMKDMPLPVHHSALAEYHGKVYMFGGYILNTDPSRPGGGWEPVDNTWQFDPGTNTWKALAPMLGKRGSAVAEEVGGQIYVIGGAIPEPGSKEVAIRASTAARSVGTNEVYDPETNKWVTRSSMPTPRNHAFGGAVNGKIYVIGGRVGSSVITTSSNTNVVEVYDPAADLWGAAGMRMPTSRSGMGWATYQNKIYVVGGQIYDRNVFAAIRAVEGYDPATNTWAILPTMFTARHGVNVAIIGNRLYAIGGHVQAAGTGGEAANTDSNEAYEFPN